MTKSSTLCRNMVPKCIYPPTTDKGKSKAIGSSSTTCTELVDGVIRQFLLPDNHMKLHDAMEIVAWMAGDFDGLNGFWDHKLS